MTNIAKGIIAGLIASALVAGALYLSSATSLISSSDLVHATSSIALTPPRLS